MADISGNVLSFNESTITLSATQPVAYLTIVGDTSTATPLPMKVWGDLGYVYEATEDTVTTRRNYESTNKTIYCQCRYQIGNQTYVNDSQTITITRTPSSLFTYTTGTSSLDPNDWGVIISSTAGKVTMVSEPTDGYNYEFTTYRANKSVDYVDYDDSGNSLVLYFKKCKYNPYRARYYYVDVKDSYPEWDRMQIAVSQISTPDHDWGLDCTTSYSTKNYTEVSGTVSFEYTWLPSVTYNVSSAQALGAYCTVDGVSVTLNSFTFTRQSDYRYHVAGSLSFSYNKPNLGLFDKNFNIYVAASIATNGGVTERHTFGSRSTSTSNPTFTQPSMVQASVSSLANTSGSGTITFTPASGVTINTFNVGDDEGIFSQWSYSGGTFTYTRNKNDIPTYKLAKFTLGATSSTLMDVTLEDTIQQSAGTDKYLALGAYQSTIGPGNVAEYIVYPAPYMSGTGYETAISISDPNDVVRTYNLLEKPYINEARLFVFAQDNISATSTADVTAYVPHFYPGNNKYAVTQTLTVNKTTPIINIAESHYEAGPNETEIQVVAVVSNVNNVSVTKTGTIEYAHYNDGYLYIKLPVNRYGSEQTGIVTISGTSGGSTYSDSIIITRPENITHWTVDFTLPSYFTSREEIYIPVITTNIYDPVYQFSTNVDWITFSGNTITVANPLNEKGTSRSGIITLRVTDGITGIFETVTKTVTQHIAWIRSVAANSTTEGSYLRRLPASGTGSTDPYTTNYWATNLLATQSVQRPTSTSSPNLVRYEFVGKDDGELYNLTYTFGKSTTYVCSDQKLIIYPASNLPQDRSYVDLYLTPKGYDSESSTWVRSSGYENAWFRMYTKDPYLNLDNPTPTVSWDTDSVTFTFTYDTEQILTPVSQFQFWGNTPVISHSIYTQNNVNYLTVNFAKNTTTSPRTIDGHIYVNESYDGTVVTVSKSFNITQNGIPYITNDSGTQSVNWNATSASWTITAHNFINPVFTTSLGGNFITNATVTNVSGDTYRLTATFPQYTSDTTTRTDTVVVTATEQSNPSATSSVTCNLSQYVSKIVVIGSGDIYCSGASAATYSYTTFNVTSLSKSVVSDPDGIISSTSMSSGTLTVNLNSKSQAVSSKGTYTATVRLSGRNSNDSSETITSDVIVKLEYANPSVSPSSQTVAVSATSATMTFKYPSRWTGSYSLTGTGSIVEGTPVLSNDMYTQAVTVNFPASTSESAITRTVTATYSTPCSGATKTITGTVIQAAAINKTLNVPSTLTVPYTGTATFTATSTNLQTLVPSSSDITLLGYNFTKTGADSNQTWTCTINLAENSTYSARTTTLTMLGTASDSSTITKTISVTQKGIGGTITPSVPSQTVGPQDGSVEVGVAYSNMNLQTVSCAAGAGDMAINSVSFNGDKSKVIVSYGANASTASTKSRTINITGQDVFGDTINASFALTQAQSGNITVSPSTLNVSMSNGSVSSVVTLTNIVANTISVTKSVAWITSVAFNPNTMQVNIEYAENLTGGARSSNVVVTGQDVYNNNYTANITITQSGDPINIVVSPASRTLTYNEEYAQFFVNYPQDLTLSYRVVSGDLVLDNRTGFYPDAGTGNMYFRVYPVENDTTLVRSSTIVVVGSVGQSSVDSNPVVVNQTGIGGGIIVSPSEATVAPGGGTLEFNVTCSNVDLSSLNTNVFDDTINVTSATVNAEGTKLTVVCAPNASNTQKSAKVSVYGQDNRGYTVSDVVTITQPAAEAYIVVDPTTQTVEASSGVTQVTYTSYGVTGISISVTGDMSTTHSTSGNTITINYDANNTSDTKMAQVLVQGTRTSDSVTIATVAIIYQKPGVTRSVYPVWDEVTITENVGSEGFTEYHIDLDGSTVYAAKVYPYPGNDYVQFSINDVASNFLHNSLDFIEGLDEMKDYFRTFNVVTSNSTSHRQSIYNSWGYKDVDYLLSDPIDYKVSCKQWLPVSFLANSYNSITVNGIPYSTQMANKGWTVMQNLKTRAIGDTVYVLGADGKTTAYKVADADYVLYYCNAYGGWDSLLCNGTSKKTDNIESLNYRRKSHSAREFSKVDYQKNITPTWSLNTGIIKNGEKMYHLLESTMVYLHDLKSDEIIPVVITNSTCDYLNYTNNGKQPVKYNITVEESNQKMRK